MNKNFLINNFKRSLVSNGRSFTFRRNKVDKYQQPIKGEFEDVVTFYGIYHEATVTAQINNYQGNSGDTVYNKKPDYKIMCLYENIYNALDVCLLKVNDFINYNGNMYYITSIKDIANLRAVCDITLKVEFHGIPI